MTLFLPQMSCSRGIPACFYFHFVHQVPKGSEGLCASAERWVSKRRHRGGGCCPQAPLFCHPTPPLCFRCHRSVSGLSVSSMCSSSTRGLKQGASHFGFIFPGWGWRECRVGEGRGGEACFLHCFIVVFLYLKDEGKAQGSKVFWVFLGGLSFVLSSEAFYCRSLPIVPGGLV